MPCANPTCPTPLPSSEFTARLSTRFGLCVSCCLTHTIWGIPTGGYIDGETLRIVTAAVLQRKKPTKFEIERCERAMRPKGHQVGEWEDRPLYRMAVLKHRNAIGRRQHILLGRRSRPTHKQIATAFVHYVLGREIIGTGHPYNRYLAGCTFFARKGLIAPAGRNPEILLGDSKSSLYRLTVSDFTGLGTQVLTAARHLGLRTDDRDLSAFIVVAYRRKRSHPPVAVHRFSMRTAYAGDSALDHKLPNKNSIPRQYWGKIRRSSGKIGRKYPIGIDPPDDEFNPKPPKPERPVPPPPSSDWIFQPR